MTSSTEPEYGYYDPDGDADWFPPRTTYKNPLDSMPIATDKSSTYSSRHEYTPQFEKDAEEIVTIHEKMYRMATKNGTTINVGGSENLGGSEERLEDFPPRPEEEICDTFNTQS